MGAIREVLDMEKLKLKATKILQNTFGFQLPLKSI